MTMYLRPILLVLMPAWLLVLPAGTALFAQTLRPLMDLRGTWKFELGDNPRWSDPAFDDRFWAEIKVPANWEDQGYPGYDGHAWYRISFLVPADWAGKKLYLELGFIDDVDEVYLNGQWIGFQGSFPPHYATAYAELRRYAIPASVLKPGQNNVVAVRVFDNEFGGGIIRGYVGIKEDPHVLAMAQSLEGTWRFRTGDDLSWKEPRLDDKGWINVRVPGFWETQGFREHDGWAWYRLTFRPLPGLSERGLVLFLGRIDDNDEVYLNGRRIGRTGGFPEGKNPDGDFNDYSIWRAYTIPPGALREGAKNVIAVRVYDRFMHGGIYDGPVGIALREEYAKWESKADKGERDSWLRNFLEWIFR